VLMHSKVGIVESMLMRAQSNESLQMILATFSQRRSSGLNARGKSLNGKKQKRLTGGNDSEDDEIVELQEGYEEDIFGWCYIGSANLTPSAWGTLTGSGFQPVLNVRFARRRVLEPLLTLDR
jgi:tyrosyl-DNA phosphodiesterase 1